MAAATELTQPALLQVPAVSHAAKKKTIREWDDGHLKRLVNIEREQNDRAEQQLLQEQAKAAKAQLSPDEKWAKKSKRAKRHSRHARLKKQRQAAEKAKAEEKVV